MVQPRMRLVEMQATACSVLKFVPFAGGVCGAATHTVGGDTGYGLLRLLVGLISPFYMIRLSLQFRK